MLHTLKPARGSVHRRKRVARGTSGKGGMTAGRGFKGQHARTGKGMRLGFEGGQVPLLMRQPKLGGFINPTREEFEVVNLDDLETMLEAGTYDVESLRAKKLVRTRKPVKLLGRGTVTKKLSLTVNAASKSAKSAIEKAGGSLTLL